MAIMAVAVAQPGADRGGHGLGVKPTKRTADGGLGRDHSSAGEESRRAPSAARIGWGVSVAHSAIAVIDRARHPGSRQGEDGDQRVTAPGEGSGVGDGGQVGEQVRCSTGRSGLVSQRGASPGGIGDGGLAGTRFQARHDTPGAARTGGRALLLTPAADGTDRPRFSPRVGRTPARRQERRGSHVQWWAATTRCTDILLAHPLTFS
jgi:hypothetical protein